MANEPTPITVDDSYLADLVARQEKSLASELAVSLVPKAIQTLEAVMKARKASHSSRVAAAREILNQAEGRPALRQGIPVFADARGLTVNILHIGPGGDPQMLGLQNPIQDLLQGRGLISPDPEEKAGDPSADDEVW